MWELWKLHKYWLKVRAGDTFFNMLYLIRATGCINVESSGIWWSDFHMTLCQVELSQFWNIVEESYANGKIIHT